MRRYHHIAEATWPAAARHRAGPWLIREGRGGGKRVSSVTIAGDWTANDIALAEAEQARIGQPPLFMLRDGEDDLDEELASRGYRMLDPVNIYAAPTELLTEEAVPAVTAFATWPMLEIMREIWEDGDVGPERIAVMERAGGRKTAILGRIGDRAAGTAFVAVDDGTAMLHALHILPGHRRRGLAVSMMRAAGFWAESQGARELTLLVTRANLPANALYASLGMQIVGNYHYRINDAEKARAR